MKAIFILLDEMGWACFTIVGWGAVPPEAALRIRRIVRAAFGAVEHQIVDLTVLCMQQNGAAISAGIIDRVIAGFENRRSADDGASCRRGNDLQADFAVRGHGSLPTAGGSATELSATDAWHMAAVDDSRPYALCQRQSV
jgi:hypothetical protein